MTRAQATSMAKEWSGTITGAIALLGTAGFVVLSPRDQITNAIDAQAKVNHAIEQQVIQQSRRIDSLAEGLQKVNALVRVKCVETKDRLIRDILECR